MGWGGVNECAKGGGEERERVREKERERERVRETGREGGRRMYCFIN